MIVSRSNLERVAESIATSELIVRGRFYPGSVLLPLEPLRVIRRRGYGLKIQNVPFSPSRGERTAITPSELEAGLIAERSSAPRSPKPLSLGVAASRPL